MRLTLVTLFKISLFLIAVSFQAYSSLIFEDVLMLDRSGRFDIARRKYDDCSSTSCSTVVVALEMCARRRPVDCWMARAVSFQIKL